LHYGLLQVLEYLLLVSHDSKWLDGGTLLPHLGSYAMIRKATSGGPVVRTKYKYLNAVHVDIVLGTASWLEVSATL
jgi:hypothetical protein